MKTEIGYKLVTNIQGRYFSYVSASGRVEYKLNEFIKRDMINGPFALFNTFVEAEAFILDDTNQLSTIDRDLSFMLFKVEYVKSRSHRLWRTIIFYNGKNKRLYCDFEPASTVYANQVKLLELIREYRSEEITYVGSY